MYKILIADDNEIARQALIESIPWEMLECELCGEVSNGIEAKGLICDKKPDIALLDIKMPGLTGLEVINEVRKKDVDTLFVIITAYDDFEYMRQGIQQNVFDYLLKPVEDKELIDILQRVTSKVDTIYANKKEKENVSRQLSELNMQVNGKKLIEALNGSNEAADAFWNSIRNQFRAHDFSIILVVPENLSNTNKDDFIKVQQLIMEKLVRTYNIYIFGVWTSEGYVFLILYKEAKLIKEYNIHSMQIANDIISLNHDKSQKCYLTISQVGKASEDIEKNYRSAVFCKSNRFFQENHTIIHYESLKSEGIKNHKNGIKKLEELHNACRFDKEKVLDTLDAFLDAIGNEEEKDIDYVKNILIQAALMMNYQIQGDVKDINSVDTDEIVELINNASSLQSVLEWMRNFGKELINDDSNKLQLSPQAKRIVDYINEFYINDISLTDVSEAVGLSGTHISRLLKQETGESFITLLNKVRIKEAIRLLKQGDNKVYEIAEMVGYNNYAYFYQTFKKYTGISPKQYN